LPTRTLAGAVVGQVLPVIFISGLAIAAIAALLEVRLSSATGHWIGKAALALVIVACIVAQFVIGPKIEAVRVAIGGAVDALDASDPRRLQFGRLHAFSVLWMGVAMIGAGLVIVQKLSLRK
jgi:predicted branched-subunit amino acid permease